MRLRNLWTIMAAVLALLLALAWYDGGLEQQRMIVEPIETPAGLLPPAARDGE